MPLSNIGYSTLSIVPSFRGVQEQLQKGMQGPADAVAAKAGGSAGAKFTKALVAGVAVAGTAVVAFGLKSANTFSKVGGEVSKLTRLTGGSADEMSRLRFAAEETGIDSDKLGLSLNTLSKHLGANDKAAKSVGISYRDASGKAKPLNTVLLELAGKFQSLPDGIDKNRLALSLFGKSGTDLLPFLNKGTAGLADLEAQAKKFGVVLTDDNLAAIKKNTIAHREWQAAMQGLQIQVGQYVLPALTSMAEFATRTLLPAIVVVSDFTSRYIGPAFSYAFGIAERVMGRVVDFASRVLVPAFKAAIDRTIVVLAPFAAKAVEYFDKARAFVDDRLIPALRDRLLPILQSVANFASEHLGPALAGLGAAGLVALVPQLVSVAGSIGGVIQAIAVLPAGLGLVLVGIGALAAGFTYAYRTSKPFRDAIDHIVGILKGEFQKALSDAKDFLDGFFGTFDRIDEAYGFFLIGDRVRVMVDKALPKLKEFGEFISTHIREAVEKLLPKLQELGEFISTHLNGTITAAVVVFGLLAGEIVGPIAILGLLYVKFQAVRDAVAVAIAAGATFADFFRSTVMPAIGAVASYIVEQFGNAVDFFQQIWPQVQEAVGHVMNAVRDTITVVVNVVSALWRAWGDDLLNIVVAAFGLIRDTVANVLQVVRGVIELVLALINGDWGKAWDALKGIVGAVFKEVGDIVRTESSQVQSIIGGVLGTIQQVWNGVWGGLRGVVDSVWVGIQNSVRTGVNVIITAINALITAYNLLPFHKDIGKIAPLAAVSHDIGSSPFEANFGGRRASGGDIWAGRTYLVGEHGPELRTDMGTGHIVSNPNLMRALNAASNASRDNRTSPTTSNAGLPAGTYNLVLPDGRVLTQLVVEGMRGHADEHS